VGAGDCSKAARVLEASKGAEVHAVDPDGKRIARARQAHPEVASSVASAESLPFPDSHFDKAYSTMALHHFAELDRALDEIARVLKPGGSYVIVEVEPRSLNGRLFRIFGRLLGEKMQIMTSDQLLARVAGVKGFAVGRSERMGGSYLLQLTRS
jgi:ubiquinone/menaquinone biosynthesis C-methylase UbiE